MKRNKRSYGGTAGESITIDGEANSGGANSIDDHTSKEVADTSPSLHGDIQGQRACWRGAGEGAEATGADGSGTEPHAVAPRRPWQETWERIEGGSVTGEHARPDSGPQATGRNGYGPGARPTSGPGTSDRGAPPSGEAAEEDETVYEGFLPPNPRERPDDRRRRRVEEIDSSFSCVHPLAKISKMGRNKRSYRGTADESIKIDGEAKSGRVKSVDGHKAYLGQRPWWPGEGAKATGTDGSGSEAHAVAPRRPWQETWETGAHAGAGYGSQATGRDSLGPGAHAIPGPGAHAIPGPGAHAIPGPGTHLIPGPGTHAIPGPGAEVTGTYCSGRGTHTVDPRHPGERGQATGRDGRTRADARPEDGPQATGRGGYGPGAHAMSGPGISDGDASPSGEAAEEEDTVYEGFLPPHPRERPEDRRRRRMEEMQRRRRREVEEMRRSAITLDDSAVRTIRNPEEAVGGRKSEDEALDEGLDGRVVWGLLAFIILVLSMGALVNSLGPFGVDAPSFARCNGSDAAVAGNVEDRYEHAKSIVSEITPPDNLDDPSSPQHKALQWIVCQDEISSRLIDGRDPATAILPTQANGFRLSGDSGEAQVLRRYALATFFFATSNQRPWSDQWNFLTPHAHECSWHKNKLRNNFPYGKFDPAGVVCQDFREWDQTNAWETIPPDDAEGVMYGLQLNFRIPNNLSGTIPPEFGHLEDMRAVCLENQKGLHGSLPSTIGKMLGLKSISLLFMGPKLGGKVPSSLFTIPSLEWIAFVHNEGTWALPSSVEIFGARSSLAGIHIAFSGLSGSISPIVSELPKLRELHLEGNSLEGTIPESFGSILGSLEYLNLRDNKLRGTLPWSIGDLSNVTAMVLGKNHFQGTVPSSLGNLRKLRLLDLSHNNLEGPVPDSFSRLSSLESVSLQNNGNMNGSISAFEPLENLGSLLLYGNSFSSTIPEGLFSYTNVAKIFADFGHNNFTGKIPKVFTQKASNTSYLAIMKNNFDAHAVDNAICDETRILFADCSSCPCCNRCCMQDSGQRSGYLFDKGQPCNHNLDFRMLAGIECGVWWYNCHLSSYDPLPLD